MTQNSNHNAFAPWGEPNAGAPAGPLMGWMTIPALLRHIVLMLTVSSVLTLLNLVTTPGVWWSFAILAIWFAVIIIHGIGLVSINLLLEDDDEEPAPAPRSRPEPLGPPLPTWMNLPKPWANGAKAPPVPTSWELKTDDIASWPDRPMTTSPAEPTVQAPERLAWREATDIAWLRRPHRANGASNGQAGGDTSAGGQEASS